MKKILVVLFSLALAIGIVIYLPTVIENSNNVIANINNGTSLVNQEIISYSEEINTINKIYASGKLIGVVNDLDYLDSLIEKKYRDYEELFPNTSLGFSEDVYITQEKSFANFSNCDDQIMDYLVNHNLLGIRTTAVEFSTENGVYEIIYVRDIEDFNTARNEFILNFISEETLNKIRNNEKIESPTDYTTVEVGINIPESITYTSAVVSPDKIFSNADQIYEFLCYGRNEERQYYTVKQGDTLQAVGYYFNQMRPKQIVMLNKDILSSENQVITPGMRLNVTYYTSPITVNVTKQVLQQTYVLPDAPVYVEDTTIESGKMQVIEEEELGVVNELYEEKWINGVLIEGNKLSENVVKQPRQGKIAVGSKLVNLIGTGNYVWPIDNPAITTDFGGYSGHTGTDFINKYGRFTNIYAVDSGVVDEVGWKNDMGYYCMIDHGFGIRTFYMHLNVPAYVKEGENVSRGQVIGQEGDTGVSYGAHLHLTFEVNSERVDACRYLPCDLIR